ncbi:MAG: response regulator [Lachnospiraceae bacterium]|nr:response regulator [Lachnospiraceae bacterium]
MSELEKSVVFIVQKYSIVASGLEKNLQNEGIQTRSVTDRYKNILELSDNTSLFILYLPEDIMSDSSKQRVLKEISGYLKDTGCPAVIIGEEKNESDVVGAFPDLKGHRWFYRPIDTETFCKDVKAMIEHPEKAATKVNEQLPSGEKKRVLIVDDDPSYAGMVRSWIKDIYKTDIVTAGMKAITFLLKNPVDIILLDYEMPVVDGPQVFQMLRQEEATQNIPVVFLTGVSTKDEVQRVMELKPDGYILKSATRGDLLGYLSKKLS